MKQIRQISLRRAGRETIALLSAISLLLQTVIPLQAQGIVVDPGAAPEHKADVTSAPNGVPMVNIATPNSSGLSHNKFQDFNVTQQGVILNNSRGIKQSQLGGVLLGNPNLANSAEASIILNEVTSSNRSLLQGMTEIHGGRASYILANPNGITCNGCGFINTPRATLTTGNPIKDASGALTGLSVDKGDVTVGALGLDARQVDYFDIISRGIALNGALHGQDVSLIAGRNDVDYATRTIAAIKADDGSTKPIFGIDSSALGGMYANRITLEGTEAGVGVKAPKTMSAGTGGMVLTADGKLVMRKATSKGRVKLRSKKSSVELQDNIHAKGDLEIGSWADVTLVSDMIAAAEGNVTIVADGDVKIDGKSVAAGMLADGSFMVDPRTLTINSKKEIVTAAGSQLKSTGDMALTAKTLNNKGEIVSGGTLTANLETSLINDPVAKIVASKNAVIVGSGTLSLTGGSVEAGEDVTITATNLTTDLAIKAKGAVRKTADILSSSGTIDAESHVILIASLGALTKAGTILSNGDVRLTAKTDLTHSGKSSAKGELAFAADNGVVIQAGSIVISGTDLLINGGSLINHGGVGAGQDLKITLSGALENNDLLAAKRDITIKQDGNLTNNKEILAANNLTIEGRAAGSRAGDVLNDKAKMEAIAGDVVIRAASFTNEGEAPTVTTTSVNHPTTYVTLQTGKWEVRRYSTKTVITEKLDKLGKVASLLAGGNLTIDVTGAITNRYSRIASNGNTVLTGGSLVNEGRELVETTNTQSYNWFWKHWGGNNGFRGTDGHSSASSSKTIGSIPATITAVGSITGSFTGQIDNVAIRQNDAQVGMSSGTGVLAPATTSVNLPGGVFDPVSLGAGSSLTVVNPDPKAKYLIETRAEFVDLSKFYNSDLFLSQLPGFDPAKTQKRLGDAYIETRSIRQQLIRLTGKRLITDVSSDYGMVKRLYDNALEEQKAHNLTPGISLTADQMASLSKDIVWLEETIVNGQKVLAPRVYLAASNRKPIQLAGARITGNDVKLTSGSVNNSGTVTAVASLDVKTKKKLENRGGTLSGEDVALQSEGELANLSGQIEGGTVAIKADSVRNETLTKNRSFGFTRGQDVAQQTAKINARKDLSVTVNKDITSVGGDIAGNKNVTLKAGGDISIAAKSLKTDIENNYGSGYTKSSSTEQRLATVRAGGNLTLDAGKDLSIKGGDVSAAKDATLAAGGDVSIASVKNTYRKEQEQFLKTGRRHYLDESATVVGSNIDAGNNLKITSGKGISVKASGLSAGDNLDITAADNVQIEGDKGFDYKFEDIKSKKLFPKKHSINENFQESYKGSSLLAGKDVSIKSGKDLTARASSIVGGGDVTVEGKSVAIEADQVAGSGYSYQKKSGLFVEGMKGGFGVTAGYRKTEDIYKNASKTGIVSAISAGNDLSIKSETDLTSQGGVLAAQNDIKLQAGGDVQLKSIEDSFEQSESHKLKEVAVSLGFREHVSKNIKTIAQAPQAATQGKGSGFNKAVTAASSALRAVDAARSLATGPLVTQEIGVSVTSKKSSSSSSATVAKLGTVTAGRDVDIKAGRDIVSEGTQIVAGRDAKLDAGRDITLKAAENNSASNTKSSEKTVGVKLTTGIGLQGPSIGLSVNASGQKSKNSANSNTKSNALVKAGRTAELKSGRDTTLKGARVEGETIKATVGRNLDIESPQDTARNSSSSKGFNAGASVDLLSGAVSVNGGVNGSQGKGTKAWVTQQSGLVAEKELDVRVEKNTNLKGGIIASKSGDLTLDTGTLTFSDIEDHDKQRNTSGGVNVSIGIDPNGNAGTPGGSVEFTDAKKDKEQITRATIGEGTLTIRDEADQKALEEEGKTENVASLNRDLDKAQEITRDEENYIGVYVSDTSVTEVINGFPVTKELLKTAAKGLKSLADHLKDEGQISDQAHDLLNEIDRSKVRNISVSCGNVQQSFSLFHLLVSPAYAAEGCSVQLNGKTYQLADQGDLISCLDALLLVAQKNPKQINALRDVLGAALKGTIRGVSVSGEYAVLGEKADTVRKIYEKLRTSNDPVSRHQYSELSRQNPNLFADLEIDRMLRSGVKPSDRSGLRTALATVFQSGFGNRASETAQLMGISRRSIQFFNYAHSPEGSKAANDVKKFLVKAEAWIDDPANIFNPDYKQFKGYVQALRKVRDGNASESDYGQILYLGSVGQQRFETSVAIASMVVPFLRRGERISTKSTNNVAQANKSNVKITKYPDGSYRTPDGKFSSQGGLPSPGTKSAQEYTQFLRSKGFKVVGEELTVKGAVGKRRYDAVLRDNKGELWGIEYKSGSARKTPQQNFNDIYINRFGAEGVGKLKGETVVGNMTIYLP